MSFIEALAQHVSIKAFALVIVAVWTALMAINRIREHRKIKSIDNYGYALQFRLPFGLDFIYYSIRSTIAHQNLDLWQAVLFADNSYTCEMRILNERTVFTADPENVKAMLATQVHDFGKGPSFKDDWSDLLGDSIFTIDGFVNAFIRRALRMSPDELAAHARSDSGYTFLHALAGFTRDPKVLRDQIPAVLIAGRDTTAATMSWAILNETLRLYPVVPFNPLPVLKNTRVAYSTLVMQRRPGLYPPASETLADPSVWHPRPHDHVPINAGPRICIGQQPALTEMSYTLCRIFQRFERMQSFMGEIDGGEPLLKSDIILSPGHGVHVAFWEAKKKVT